MALDDPHHRRDRAREIKPGDDNAGRDPKTRGCREQRERMGQSRREPAAQPRRRPPRVRRRASARPIRSSPNRLVRRGSVQRHSSIPSASLRELSSSAGRWRGTGSGSTESATRCAAGDRSPRSPIAQNAQNDAASGSSIPAAPCSRLRRSPPTAACPRRVPPSVRLPSPPSGSARHRFNRRRRRCHSAGRARVGEMKKP